MLQKFAISTDIFSKTIHKFAAWLKPAARECIGCGQTFSGPGRIPLLCDRCAGQVPWIVRPACAVCGRGDICPDCVRSLRHFALNRSAVRYTAEMKSWHARYKFRGDERMEALFGAMLHAAYRHHYGRLRTQPDAIAYVPISCERLKERGFNQTERMAASLGQALNLPALSLLDRVRHTDKQSVKGRRDRIAGVDSLFAPRADADEAWLQLTGNVSSDREPGPIRLLLVDDVYTTGSTMNACAGAIRRRWEAEVYGLTWAR